MGTDVSDDSFGLAALMRTRVKTSALRVLSRGELNGVSKRMLKDGQDGGVAVPTCAWIMLWNDLGWEVDSPGLSCCQQ